MKNEPLTLAISKSTRKQIFCKKKYLCFEQKHFLTIFSQLKIKFSFEDNYNFNLIVVTGVDSGMFIGTFENLDLNQDKIVLTDEKLRKIHFSNQKMGYTISLQEH